MLKAIYDKGAILCLLLLAGLSYLFTMPQVITLEDAGLFQMVCHFDGIGHPPGYPLFTLMCNQMALSTAVFYGNFISTIFALSTLFVFYLLVVVLLKDSTSALVATFAYAFSATFWSQAIIIEVYSLTVFLFIFSWWLLLKYRQTERISYWYLFCFVTALGLSNHWPLHVLSSLGLGVILYSCRKFFWQQAKKPYFILCSTLLFLTGLSPYLSLIFNSDPEIAVFGAVPMESFFDYVSRSYYADNYEGAGSVDKLNFFLWLIPESGLQFGVLALPFVLLGFIRSWWDLSKANSISLAILYLMTTFVLVSLMSFKFDLLYQGIFKPYPIIAYAPLSIWFSLGLTFAIKNIERRFQVLILVLIAASIFMTNFQKVDRSSSRIVDDYGRLILNSLPENAVLFVQGDNETGPIGYLNRVEGLRIDITLFDAQSLVFSNRLTRATVSDEALEQAYKTFLKDTDRPVYRVSGDDFAITTNGLYSRVATGDQVNNWKPVQQQYELNPDFDRYIDYLLSLYEDDLLFDIHEQRFVYNTIIAYTKAYLSYGFQHGFSQEQFIRLKRLQLTFPGMLVTLGRQLRANVDPLVLLSVAESLISKITKRWPTKHLALSYEYYGLVLERLNRQVEAKENFEESIRLNDVKSNLSLCHLDRLMGISNSVCCL